MTIDQTFEDKKKEYNKLIKQLLKVGKATNNTLNESSSDQEDISKPRSSIAIYDKALNNIRIAGKGADTAAEIIKKMNEIYSSLTDDEKKNLNEKV